MGLRKFVLLAGLILGCAGALAKQQPAEKPSEPQDDAAAFGALESIRTAGLSSDGKRLVYVGADGPSGTVAVVVNLETGISKKIARADGHPFNLMGCEWSAAERIVCGL